MSAFAEASSTSSRPGHYSWVERQSSFPRSSRHKGRKGVANACAPADPHPPPPPEAMTMATEFAILDPEGLFAVRVNCVRSMNSEEGG